jgi:16S rRNA processing protein RimM
MSVVFFFNMDLNNLELICKITRAVGLAGELEIKTYEGYNLNSEEGEPLFFEINKSKIPFFISEIRQTGDRYRIKFDDIDSQDQAQQFSNIEIFAPKQVAPPAQQNEFSSIIGYIALDEKLGELGKITGIQEYPGQQVLEINYNNKEVLLPVTNDFISRIDHKNSIVYVQCPDGLLDIYK